MQRGHHWECDSDSLELPGPSKKRAATLLSSFNLPLLLLTLDIEGREPGVEVPVIDLDEPLTPLELL